MAVFKKERKMKVYAQSGYKYKDTATIILKGDWLEDCGFEPGTPIRVECEGGRLVITRQLFEVFSDNSIERRPFVNAKYCRT